MHRSARAYVGLEGCAGIEGWCVDDVTVSECSATLATKDDAAS